LIANCQQAFHLGVRNPDIDAAMEETGDALGTTWATAQYSARQPLWTRERGFDHYELSFVYSCDGPQHLELPQGEAGSIWDGRNEPGVHHVGPADGFTCYVDPAWRALTGDIAQVNCRTRPLEYLNDPENVDDATRSASMHDNTAFPTELHPA
jgi:hypothetical protein